MVWDKLAIPAALSGDADLINSGTFTAKKHLYFEGFLVNSGSIRVELKLGSGGSIDTGDNYSSAWTPNGGSQGYRESGHDSIEPETASSSNAFIQGWIDNPADGRKLCHFRLIYDGGTDVVPTRIEVYGKWENESAQANVLELFNGSTGSFASGSELTVWGSDGGAPTVGKDIVANIPVGSRYEEIDTRKIYRFINTSFSDDFSSTSGWTAANNDEFTLNTGNSRMEFDIERDGTADTYTKPLGFTISDTKWVMRFKIRCDATTADSSGISAGTPYLFLALAEDTNSLASSGDICGFELSFDSVNTVSVKNFLDNGRSPYGTTIVNLAVDTDYYITVTRDNLAITNTIRTGSHTGTQIGTGSTNLSSGVGDLDTIKFCRWEGSGGVSSTEFSGYVQDLEIYDGVTSAPIGWVERGTAA